MNGYSKSGQYLGVFVLIVFCLVLLLTGGLGSLETGAEDRLYQRLGLVDPNIFIIGIDEETLTELGPYQTWSREIIAETINQLNADPQNAPAAIGVDVLFAGHTEPKADDALVQAAAKLGNVVLASFASFGGDLQSKDGETYALTRVVRSFEQPFAELKAEVTTGFMNTLPDEDGVVRRSLHQIEVEGQLAYGLAYEIYKKYTGAEVFPPLDNNEQWYLAYSGAPGEYYGSAGEGTSLIKVLRGELPPETFAGSMVLIGPYTSGLMDSYQSPIATRSQMYGVEIQANILQALLDENFKVPVGIPIQAGILVISLGAFVLLFHKIDIRLAAVILVIFIIAYELVVLYAYGRGYLLQVIYLPISLGLLFVYYVSYNYLSERYQRRAVTGLFKRYVAPQVVEGMIKKGGKNLVLGGERRPIAVLFVDIRGFTQMSETLEPEEIVAMLNQYLELATSAIFAHGGMVDKFIGDGIMAVFNAPMVVEDYKYGAILTALDIMASAVAFGEETKAKYGKAIGLGLGINWGDAVVGNIGTSLRMDYTAIGDVVNTAARLESSAKPGQILITAACFADLDERIIAESLGMLQMKGKRDGVEVFRVLGVVK